MNLKTSRRFENNDLLIFANRYDFLFFFFSFAKMGEKERDGEKERKREGKMRRKTKGEFRVERGLKTVTEAAQLPVKKIRAKGPAL